VPSPKNPWKPAIVALAAAAIVVVSMLVARHPFSPAATRETETSPKTATQAIPSSFVYRDAGAEPGAQRTVLSSAAAAE
jgi:hypothetical protein